MKKPSISPLLFTQMVVAAALIIPLAACSGMVESSTSNLASEGETTVQTEPAPQSETKPVEAPVVAKPEQKPEETQPATPVAETPVQQPVVVVSTPSQPVVEQPKADQPQEEPKPVAQPEPAKPAPQQPVVQPEPAKPAPVVQQPEPVKEEPKAEQPKEEPKPVVQPEPAKPAPQQPVVQPEPAKPAPQEPVVQQPTKPEPQQPVVPAKPVPGIVAGIDFNAATWPLLEGQKAPLNMIPYWWGYPWIKVPDGKQWGLWLIEEIRGEGGKPLLNTKLSDAGRFCKNFDSFSQDQKTLFWLRFFSVLSEMECTYRPKQVTHDVAVGPNIYSSGLFQLSIESSQYKPFGCTMIKSQEDLLDPRKNIACAIRIFSYYINKDKQIAGYDSTSNDPWRGGPRYWGPFRTSKLKTAEGRAELDKMIEQKRPLWTKEATVLRSPAYKDEDYIKAKEPMYEKMLRLMNEMQICH